MISEGVSIWPLPGLPLIRAGDDLPALILRGLVNCGQFLENGDVLVISSKIISKSEGRIVDLQTVTPSDSALELAEKTGKDPRVVEMVLQESRSVSRISRGVLVTTHRLGFTSANAGIDQSNVAGDDNIVLLLPVNPDETAKIIRERIRELADVTVGIVISDTHGRPFRMGNVGVAIGVSGLSAVLDLRGQKDLFGRVMKITQSGYADLVASAAHLVCGEGDEGLPVVVVRGLPATPEGTARDLVRDPDLDLYR